LESKHQTVGIDITISNEDLILLDTQPVYSSSILYEMYVEEPPIPSECLTYENVIELQSIQLTVFLMSVCHIVLVVQDGSSMDWKIWQLLKTVSMLKTRFPDPSSKQNSISTIIQNQRHRTQLDKIKSTLDPNDLYNPESEYFPNLIFVFNKSPPTNFYPNELKNLGETLDLFFSNTSYIKSQNLTTENNEVDKESETLNDIYDHKIKGHVNFFMLPLDTKNHILPITTDLRFNESFEVGLNNLKDTILSLTNSNSLSKFENKITQGEWLTNSAVIWDIIKRSPMLLDYNKTMQTTNYKTNYYE